MISSAVGPDAHQAVLLEEAVDALNIKSGGVYVDATFGRGGHSRAVLARLSVVGRLIALDRDPQAMEAGATIADVRFKLLHGDFGDWGRHVRSLGVSAVDGALFDLGMSSPQLDDAGRGFSFRRDGPLDMRMDTSSGETAAQWLARATETDIREVIKRYGEERFAKQIARAIVAARASGPVERTRQLAQIVAEAIPTREPRQDPATRTFQAIRIHVNQELAQLESALTQCIDLIRPEGRLVVISFHSLEDRMVKQYMRRESQPGDLPLRLPLRARELPRPHFELIGKKVTASAAEIAANPRARSAVMRVAERLAP